jgi:hypothetical protein
MPLRFLGTFFATAAVACGSNSAGSSGTSGDGGSAGLVTSVSGSADGTPFASAGGSLWIGSPDSAATTVVYVFSKPVACDALSSPGWDTRIADATQVLEMKAFGTMPGTFAVVTTATPAPGEASINYTLSSVSGAPVETSASGGTVTLSSLASQQAQGQFALKFGGNSLNGTFAAAFCPGGHEP